ncbi:hypothetical protein [Pantoea ananatis]|uniref:hypothetical protein n=1 Tax=Pantoea ananas TaxID=553 RepID=UPI000D5F5617|nr:hypothetical protein [Pantoea ananatis]PVY82393.1 hypothetical protein C7427_11021 [Pantoea ananatis]
MHYTRMINPITLLNCDSPASAKTLVDYVKTQLSARLDYRLMVDADSEVPADGLPDYLTFLRHVARTVGFATENSYIRYAFIEEVVTELSLLGTSVHSLHWNAAFHEGATRSREDKELDNATKQLRAMFYQSADASDIV